LNLLRVFGTGLGVAAASAELSWRLSPSNDVTGSTLGAQEGALLAAVGDVLLMLAAFAAVAAGASLLRSGGPTGQADRLTGNSRDR
jgi:hypothetical protein